MGLARAARVRDERQSNLGAACVLQNVARARAHRKRDDDARPDGSWVYSVFDSSAPPNRCVALAIYIYQRINTHTHMYICVYVYIM